MSFSWCHVRHGVGGVAGANFVPWHLHTHGILSYYLFTCMLRCLQVDFRVMSNDATGKLSQLHWCYAACHVTGTYTHRGCKTPSVTNRVCCWWSFHNLCDLLWTAGKLQSGSGLQCDRRCQNLRHGSNIPTEVHLCGLMFCVEIRIACGSAVIETMYIESI